MKDKFFAGVGLALFTPATLPLLLDGVDFTACLRFTLTMGKMLDKTYFFDELARKATVGAVEKLMEASLSRFPPAPFPLVGLSLSYSVTPPRHTKQKATAS